MTLTDQHIHEVATLTTTAPTHAADIIAILRDQDPMPAEFVAGQAFYSAEDSDQPALLELLQAAGWRLVWFRAPYYWQARHPDTGDTIRYVEGDVYTTPEQPL